MIAYGLTGGVGVGKSAVGALIAERGVPIVDTDVIAREVVHPGTEGFRLVVERFGPEILNTEGMLDRRALAELVFADSEKRKELEGILHPLIRGVWKRRISQCREEGARAAVVVIPLLFETGAEGQLDKVICVACTEVTQKARLRERDWDEEEISNRIAAQLSLKEKMERADYVIWNESSLDICCRQLDRIAGLTAQKAAVE
jgi:dephospho-CoA kinase